MTEKPIQDERILQQRRFIQSRGYAYLVLILAVSVLVQQFVLHAPFAQYAVEFFLLIGCGFYNLVCNCTRGIDIVNPTGKNPTQLLVESIETAVVGTAVLALLGGERDWQDLLFFFIAFVAVMFGARLGLILLTRKKQEEIDKALDQDED